MPPRPARSTQAASSNIPVRDTPLVTPASRSSSTTPSARSNESLTPVPSTPVHEPLESSTEPEDLLLPQPRLATAAEIERLNDIIAGLQRQVEGLNTYRPRDMKDIPHSREKLLEGKCRTHLLAIPPPLITPSSKLQTYLSSRKAMSLPNA
ncbi:hypothetical protein QFC24_005615 [Naganishia onofrii]|uniref:Uncharacterized protein n=1 Tax=Naganishia onofrii TaxID=1851511 RepID=A0ACC2X7Z3_9TREE|nr:hypothetical protein QFC24_005615 [Naganishia onofrii]